MVENIKIIKYLMDEFGDDVKVGDIAQYAEDEFLIPKKEAVNIIVDTIMREV